MQTLSQLKTSTKVQKSKLLCVYIKCAVKSSGRSIILKMQKIFDLREEPILTPTEKVYGPKEKYLEVSGNL